MPIAPILTSQNVGPAAMNEPIRAAAFFAARLDFQTDVSDVRAGLLAATPGFVLIDSRSRAAWDQGHIPGAVHLPTAEIGARVAGLLDPAVPVITYCWGPGCNGATRAALALALAGYSVKEMIGGVEYWVREGFPLRTREGDVVAGADPLTAPVGPGVLGVVGETVPVRPGVVGVVGEAVPVRPGVVVEAATVEAATAEAASVAVPAGPACGC